MTLRTTDSAIVGSAAPPYRFAVNFEIAAMIPISIVRRLDPYMRGRISGVRSYARPVEVGAVMEGRVAGEVARSRDPAFHEGDFAPDLSDSQFRKRRSILLFRPPGKEEFVSNEPANKRNRKAIDLTVGTNHARGRYPSFLL